MPKFEAYISMPKNSAPDLISMLDTDCNSLKPLTEVAAEVNPGPWDPYNDWISVNGTVNGTQEAKAPGSGRDADDQTALLAARLLSGHLFLIAPGSQVHRVAVGHSGRSTPLADSISLGYDPVNKPARRPLAVLATANSSNSGIWGVEAIGLGNQAKIGSLLPIFPLVIETAGAPDSQIEIFDSYDELEAWAHRTFNEWTIVSL